MKVAVLISARENSGEILQETPQESFFLHACIWLNVGLFGHAGTWAQKVVMMLVWPANTSHRTQAGQRMWLEGRKNAPSFAATRI